MRADRLVSILLMLQRRGKVTAGEVAEELEISERTARRDLDALAMAGLPVYATQGRGGGWQLLGGGRTDLSGLSADETRALFLLAGPRAVTPELRAALRKLVRALPEPMRDRAEAAADAVVFDPQAWGGPSRTGVGPAPGPEPEHLGAVQDAVIDGHQLWLDYVDRTGAVSRRRVDPLGLVAKGNRWYLVTQTDEGQRTFRVDRVRGVEPTGDAVARPAGFDLSQAWRDIADRIDDIRLPVQARILVEPTMVGLLRYVFGPRLGVGASGADGRVEMEIRGWADYSLAAELAGFAAAVEVTAPASIRSALAVIGAGLVDRYGRPEGENLPDGPQGGRARRVEQRSASPGEGSVGEGHLD